MDSKAQRIAGKILVKLDDEHNEMKEFLDFIYAGYLSVITGNTRSMPKNIYKHTSTYELIDIRLIRK